MGNKSNKRYLFPFLSIFNKKLDIFTIYILKNTYRSPEIQFLSSNERKRSRSIHQLDADGDSVLGFTKYQMFCTYSEAAAPVMAAGYSDYNVFDGQSTYRKVVYEQNRGHRLHTSDISSEENGLAQHKDVVDTEISHAEHQEVISSVYIDKICTRNGSSNAQEEFGLFWDDEDPWNCNQTLSYETTVTNNKAVNAL